AKEDKPHESIIDDGDVAAADARAAEGERKSTRHCKGVCRRSGVERKSANRCIGRERQARNVRRPEERGAGRHRGRRPVGGGIEIRTARSRRPGRILGMRWNGREQGRGPQPSSANVCVNHVETCTQADRESSLCAPTKRSPHTCRKRQAQIGPRTNLWSKFSACGEEVTVNRRLCRGPRREGADRVRARAGSEAPRT